MRTQRFQNRVTAGRFTLPVAILLSVACWILSAILLPDLDVQKDNYPLWNTFCNSCIPAWGNRLSSFILYSVIGYFLIGLNNAFAIIRMRASVQTGIYFLLISVCPSLHVLYAGDLAAIAFLIALFSCSRAISIPSLPVIFSTHSHSSEPAVCFSATHVLRTHILDRRI